MAIIEPRSRLNALTGLRGIAAYSVLLAHGIDTSFFYSGVPVFHPAAARLAYFGMSLFFVLSGFVIYYNYAALFTTDRLAAAAYRFFVARFSRLYPLYAFSILVAVVYIPSPWFAGDPATALSYLTLTQSWFNREMAMFPPDWSISTEWLFYAAFVPLSFFLARVRRPLRALLALSILAPIGLMTLFHFQDAAVALLTPVLWHGEKVSAPLPLWLGYFSPYLRLLEFIAGALAARAFMDRDGFLLPVRPERVDAVMAVCAAWCVAVVLIAPISDLPGLSGLLPNFIFAPALALLLYGSARDGTWFGRALACRPLLFMGNISYSVYIWCWSAFVILQNQFVSPAASPLAYFNSSVKLLACIVITTVMADGSYRLVEVPAQRWLRSVLTRKVARRVTVSAAAVLDRAATPEG